MDGLNRIPDRQIEYAFEAYGEEAKADPNKLLRKLIALYTLGSGGYWEAMADTIQSTALEEYDESVAIELYDHDASAIAGIMSCLPAVILTLVKLLKTNPEVLNITEEDVQFLNTLDNLRGENKLAAFLDMSGADQLLEINSV